MTRTQIYLYQVDFWYYPQLEYTAEILRVQVSNVGQEPFGQVTGEGLKIRGLARLSARAIFHSISLTVTIMSLVWGIFL